MLTKISKSAIYSSNVVFNDPWFYATKVRNFKLNWSGQHFSCCLHDFFVLCFIIKYKSYLLVGVSKIIIGNLFVLYFFCMSWVIIIVTITLRCVAFQQCVHWYSTPNMCYNLAMFLSTITLVTNIGLYLLMQEGKANALLLKIWKSIFGLTIRTSLLRI